MKIYQKERELLATYVMSFFLCLDDLFSVALTLSIEHVHKRISKTMRQERENYQQKFCFCSEVTHGWEVNIIQRNFNYLELICKVAFASLR